MNNASNLPNNAVFVIEHAEPELFEWNVIECEQMGQYVPKEQLWFTHMPGCPAQLKDAGICHTKSITQMGLSQQKICVLDPTAKEILSPKDASQFDYFVFGGILGDKEFDGRTGKFVTSQMPGVAVRNLGPKHLATDTAVLVARLLLEGKKYEEIRLATEVEVEINEYENVTLPFAYVILDDKAMISEKLIEHLREREEF